MYTAAEVKQSLNDQFARTAKALAHPRRIELLELLAQGERHVDALAAATELPVTTVSSHLQLLREARLVSTRRQGTRVFYRVASDEILVLLGALRDTARSRLPEVELIERSYFSPDPGDAAESLGAGDAPEAEPAEETVSREELLQRARRGEVVVIDVRPRVEYDSGHIEGALSIPLDELEQRLDELPGCLEIVAYCRGPFCVLAPEAIRLLRRRGLRARRLDSGLPEWRLAGHPISTTSQGDDR